MFSSGIGCLTGHAPLSEAGLPKHNNRLKSKEIETFGGHTSSLEHVRLDVSYRQFSKKLFICSVTSRNNWAESNRSSRREALRCHCHGWSPAPYRIENDVLVLVSEHMNVLDHDYHPGSRWHQVHTFPSAPSRRLDIKWGTESARKSWFRNIWGLILLENFMYHLSREENRIVWIDANLQHASKDSEISSVANPNLLLALGIGWVKGDYSVDPPFATRWVSCTGEENTREKGTSTPGWRSNHIILRVFIQEKRALFIVPFDLKPNGHVTLWDNWESAVSFHLGTRSNSNVINSLFIPPKCWSHASCIDDNPE
jgi:hypothetical protein